jgi:hypothetical protein
METEPHLLPLLPLVRQTARDNRELWRKLDPVYDDSLDFTEDDDWEIIEVQKADDPDPSTVFGWDWLYSEFKILFNYSYMAAI